MKVYLKTKDIFDNVIDVFFHNHGEITLTFKNGQKRILDSKDLLEIYDNEDKE